MTSNVQFYTDEAGEHRWRIQTDDGEIICPRDRGFPSKASAVNNLLMTHTLLTLFVAEMAKKGVHAD